MRRVVGRGTLTWSAACLYTESGWLPPAHLPVDIATDKVADRERRRGLVTDAAVEAELERALADLAAAEEHARETLRVLALSARRAGGTMNPEGDGD